MSRRPLEGIRVIECGTIIAAPMCAMLLADWGAEVIKVEHPGGDAMRRSGVQKSGVGLNFKFFNRNKRHIVLDLSKPDGQDVMRELAAKSDVLIENFRPGVMEKWNLGWEALHELNTRLVMLRMTGFGQFGPYSKRAGFGTLAESMSGFAFINGYPDGPPTLPPFGLADGVAALSAAYGIMLALYDRDTKDGTGQMIDVAIIEPLFNLLGAQTSIYDQTRQIKGRTGNRTGNHAPRNIYKTRDERWIAISTAAQSVAERVMRLVGHPEVIEQPWFRKGEDRARHADELDAMVGDWVGARDYVDVIAGFEEAGAAIAPIYDISQIMEDPQYQALESIVSLDDDDLGKLKMQNLLFRMSKTPGKVRHPARRLGQDTDAVLRDVLNLSDERLAALHADGTIEPKPDAEPSESMPS